MYRGYTRPCCIPSLDKRIMLSCGYEEIHHVVGYRWNGHAVRGGRILELVPAYIIHVSHQEDAAIHPGASVFVETSTSEEISAVRSRMSAVHGLVVISIGQACWNILCGIVGRLGNTVNDADSPSRPADANPADYVASTPSRHAVNTAVPEGPDVLLGCNGLVLPEGAEYLVVGSFIVILDRLQFILVLEGDLDNHDGCDST